jgi:Lysylphosphatidylglycerol synthase TM region
MRDAAWLALGVALHLTNQLARGRGWHVVVRAALPDAPLRCRDTVAAWVAGAGAGGLVSARGGDAVRVLVLARRAPGVPWPVLAGTVVAEGAGEAAIGLGLLAAAGALGAGPRLGAPHTIIIAAAVVAIGLAAFAARRFAAPRRLAARIRTGCTALTTPRAYAATVLAWQLASRACRLAALACFLHAFGLPVTPAAVLLVTFAQTGGRLIPFGPAAVGAGVAMLAAAFEPVTGAAVPASQLAAFFVGTSTVLTVVGTALTVAICLRVAGWRDLAEAVQASARAGRRTGFGALRGRRPARATASPRP